MCYLKNNQLDYHKNIAKVVVWSASNKTWAGVSTANRSRDSGVKNGTYQIVEKGDMIVLSTLDPDTKETVVTARVVTSALESADASLYNLTTIAPDSTTDVGVIFQNITHNLWLWLYNLEDVSDGFLPAGIGWDGNYTLYDQRKRDRIRAILYGVTDEILTSTLLEAGQISSGSETPTNWSDATGLPHTEPCVLEWEVNSNSKMVYAVSWFKDNVVQTTKHTTDLTSGMSFSVDPAATKVLIGTINVGGDKTKHLTRWKLYTR